MLISLSKKYLKIKHLIKLSCHWVWNDQMSHKDPISMPHWICNDQCPIPNRTGCCSRRVATSIFGPVRNLKENSLPVKMRMIKFPLPLQSGREQKGSGKGGLRIKQNTVDHAKREKETISSLNKKKQRPLPGHTEWKKKLPKWKESKAFTTQNNRSALIEKKGIPEWTRKE